MNAIAECLVWNPASVLKQIIVRSKCLNGRGSGTNQHCFTKVHGHYFWYDVKWRYLLREEVARAYSAYTFNSSRTCLWCPAAIVSRQRMSYWGNFLIRCHTSYDSHLSGLPQFCCYSCFASKVLSLYVGMCMGDGRPSCSSTLKYHISGATVEELLAECITGWDTEFLLFLT